MPARGEKGEARPSHTHSHSATHTLTQPLTRVPSFSADSHGAITCAAGLTLDPAAVKRAVAEAEREKHRVETDERKRSYNSMAAGARRSGATHVCSLTHVTLQLRTSRRRRWRHTA